MSFSNKLTELSNKLSTLAIKIKLLSGRPRISAQVADDSLKLEGQTGEELGKFLTSNLPSHTFALGDPHTTNADQVGIFTKAEIDRRIKTMIPAGILPISNYGIQNYLPVSVAGSFQGATTDPTHRAGALLVEEDGTLVILRNGVNGSKAGIYYMYSPNAEVGVFTAPVRTNREYRPTYFPSGIRARYLRTASEYLLMGGLEDVVEAENQGYFISLTNGTMDDRLHTGCIIPKESSHVVAPINNVSTTNLIMDGVAYFFTFPAPSQSGDLKIIVHMCRVSDIENGTLDEITKFTDIECHGYFNGPVQRDHIQIAHRITSADMADEPLIFITDISPSNFNIAHSNNYGISAASNDEGKIRIALSMSAYINTPNTSRGASTVISLVFDPVAKTAKVDPGINDQATVTIPPARNIIHIAGDLFQSPSGNMGAGGSQSTPARKILTKNGVWFRYMSGTYVDQADVNRIILNDFSTPFEGMRRRTDNNVVSSTSRADLPLFATALGSGLGGTIWLGGDRILLAAYGRNVAGQIVHGQAYVKLEGGSKGYRYPSYLGNSTKWGFRPTSDRTFMADMNTPHIFQPTCEVSGENTVISGWTFSSSSGIDNANRPQFIAPDLSISGSLLTLATSVSVGVARRVTDNLRDIVDTPTHLYTSTVIPQSNGVPPFMWICSWDSVSRKIHYILVEIAEVISHAGVVSDLVVGRVYPPVYIGTSLSYGTGSGYRSLTSAGAWCFYDTGDTVLIGGTLNYTMSGGGIRNVGFKWSKLRQQFEFQPTGPRMYSYYTVPHSDLTYFVSPEFGMSIANGGVAGSNINDSFTKCIIAPMAKTEEEWDAWKVPSESEWVVLASQDVAEGWSIYFTDPTPVFMKGNPYLIDIATINLVDIDPAPANKTFYVYVQLIDDRPEYVIRTTELPETFTTMFIGTVKTNLTQIESIDVDKVYRIDTMRMSTVAIGSAIPTTSGHPADVVKLNWT